MIHNKILIDSAFLDYAQGLIMSAKKTIYLSSFKVEIGNKSRFTKLNTFFESLIKIKKLGVDVRLLTNKQGEQGYTPHTNARVLNTLKKEGIGVRTLRNNRICHAKLILIDDLYGIVGSHNLSLKSCKNNFEVSYLVTEKFIISELVAQYIKLWYSGKDA